MPLSTKTIDRISGPVSMYILKPKETILERFSGLPIYILFGDIHYGNENMCEEDKSPGGTYNIYDIKFLNIFNKLSTPEEPIDFFLEGPDLHRRTVHIPFDKPYPLDKFYSIYVECYENKQKKLAGYEYDQKQCEDIKNIRWQSADPRQFRDRKYQDPHVTGCTYSSLMFDIRKTLVIGRELLKHEFKLKINHAFRTAIENYGRDCINKLLVLLLSDNPFDSFDFIVLTMLSINSELLLTVT